LTCHSLDGSRKIGPSFLELADGKAIVIENGIEKKVVIDSSYIKSSIIDPNYQLVKGYKPNLMPQIEGRYSEEDLDKFVELFLLKETEETIAE
jgi:cytochrome c oxidase subunit 2